LHLDGLAFPVEAKRLNRRIKANFIAELEAVGKSLLRTADTRDYGVEFMGFHTLSIGLTGKPIGLRWVVQAGFLCSARQRDVDLVGYLGGDLLKRQCRDQADQLSMSRHAKRHLTQVNGIPAYTCIGVYGYEVLSLILTPLGSSTTYSKARSESEL